MGGETGEELALLEASNNHNNSNNSSNNSSNCDENSESSRGNSGRGLLAAFVFVVLTVISADTVQLIEHRIPDFELNTFRCVIPLMLYCLAALVHIRRWPVIERAQIPYVMAYTVLGLTSSVAHYTAYASLPVTSVTCLSYTVQVLAGIIIFRIFWTERITPVKFISVMTCTIGIVLVMQPSFIFDRVISTQSASNNKPYINLTEYSAANNQNVSLDWSLTDYKWITSSPGTNNNVSGFSREYTGTNNNASGPSPPESVDPSSSGRDDFSLHNLLYVLPILGGMARLLDVLLLKKRPYLLENIVQVLFWSFLFSSILSACVSFMVENPVVPSGWFDWTMAVTHGLSYALLWPVYMYAAVYIEGTTYNLVATSGTVLMLISQYTFLSSILPGHRNWMEVLGALMVTFGVSVASLFEVLKGFRKNN